MNILITGSPGVGKTTLVKKVLALYSGQVAGFYTEEIREAGRRRGFKVRAIGDVEVSTEGILAHENFPGLIKVGKYGVNVEEFEKVGVSALKKACGGYHLIIIDEIGKMELYSEEFKRTVEAVLDLPNSVLATIGKFENKFVDKVKKRKDVVIFELTYRNRDEMPGKIVETLKGGFKK